MKLKVYIYGLILFVCSSCATLNISEIKNLEKVAFDSLKLEPGREVNDLRIDLIRQTHSESINDSTQETKKTAYNPIGFDFGNGLFYDLNKNICLRIDYLMGFSSDENFEISEFDKPEKNKGQVIYRFNNDSLTVKYSSRKKSYCYYRTGNADSTSYMYKKRMQYAIVETDSSLTYSDIRRKWDVIHKVDENNYYLNKKRGKENYRISGSDIFLKKDYIVRLTNNNLTIEILSQRKRKSRVLYKIEQSSDKLFFYNEKFHGLKIEHVDNEVLVYTDQHLISRFKLKK